MNNLHADFRAVLDEVNCADTAELLGLRMEKRSGGKTAIECPFHEEELGRPDMHIGNCVISSTGRTCTCYSCGRHGNPIDMVRAKLSYGFSDAVDYLAANLAPHLLRQKTDAQPKPKMPVSMDDLRFIGLHVDGFYAPIASYSSKYEAKQETKGSFTELRYDEKSGCVLGCKWEKPFLTEMFEKDPDVFAEMALSKAEERERNLKNALKQMEAIPPGEMSNAMRSQVRADIARVQDITYKLLEFADDAENNSKKQEEENKEEYA